MHYVAIGEYDKVTEISGEDEIAELYKELEKMMDMRMPTREFTGNIHIIWLMLVILISLATEEVKVIIGRL